MLRGLVTAFRTLTILPVPGKDDDSMASSLPWFPVVGLALGGILCAIATGTGLLLGNPWPEGVAALVIVGGVILTRAIHLDGLADWADGFGGRGDRTKILAIMKDPHIGSFGVVAVVTVLLVKWVALTRCIGGDASIMIIISYVVSRAMMAELAASLPYARAEGGTAAPFVRNARPVHRIIALIVALAVVAAPAGPVTGAAAFVTGWIVCRMFGVWCRRRIGGVTGDILGACGEIVETLLVVCGGFFGDAIGTSGGW
jgi:adenosylcobinamide-GDP ribazoletransferase